MSVIEYPSLHRQLQEKKEALLLIEERMSQYVQDVDVPLQLQKDEKRLRQEIAELQQRIAQIQQQPCPYLGLRTFTEKEAHLFFGREAMVTELIDEIKKQPLVVLVGASGAGKSSLVRAGLIPQLRQDAIPGSKEWSVEIVEPDIDPLRALTSVLVKRLHPEFTLREQMVEARAYADELRKGRISLRGDLLPTLQTVEPSAQPGLLIIDQFEETFGPEVDAESRRIFLQSVVELAESGGFRILVVLRADFYSALLESSAINHLLPRSQVNLKPMSYDELRAVIERPAAATGRRFEEGLVDTILQAVGDDPGNLALLEFTLFQLWRYQNAAGEITFEAYRTIGEVEGAIAQHAANVVAGLTPDEQQSLWRLMGRLVYVPNDAAELIRRSTRRRIRLRDLEPALQALAQTKLAQQRLVTVLSPTPAEAQSQGGEHAPSAPTGTVELVHEALIRHWDDLRGWLQRHQDGLRVHQALTAQVEIWERYNGDPSLLYRGRQLQAIVADSTLDLNEREREFICASQRRVRMERSLIFGGYVLAGVALLGLLWLIFLRPEAPSVDELTIPMPEADFNFAVAPITIVDPESIANRSTLRALERDSDSLEAIMVEFLKAESTALAEDRQRAVNVLASHHFTLTATTDEALAQLADELNANVLIYGTLSYSGGRLWQLQPNYWVRDVGITNLVEDILGDTFLAAPISLIPGQNESFATAQMVIGQRLRTLLILIQGIPAFDLDTIDGHEKANQILCSAANEVDAQERYAALSMLFLFCAQTETRLGFKDKALDTYKQGLALDPQNTRLLLSTAEMLLRTYQPQDMKECKNGNRDKNRDKKVEEGYDLLTRAQEIVSQNQNLRLITDIGLKLITGHYAFWYGCYEPENVASHWQVARNAYLVVIEDMEAAQPAIRRDFVSVTAREAHEYLGRMFAEAYRQSQNQAIFLDTTIDDLREESVEHYRKAMDYLTDFPEELSTSDSVIPTLVHALVVFCYFEHSDLAHSSLEELSQIQTQFTPQEFRQKVLNQLQPETQEMCKL